MQGSVPRFGRFAPYALTLHGNRLRGAVEQLWNTKGNLTLYSNDSSVSDTHILTLHRNKHLRDKVANVFALVQSVRRSHMYQLQHNTSEYVLTFSDTKIYGTMKHEHIDNLTFRALLAHNSYLKGSLPKGLTLSQRRHKGENSTDYLTLHDNRLSCEVPKVAITDDWQGLVLLGNLFATDKHSDELPHWVCEKAFST